jgi:hypothetical protein
MKVCYVNQWCTLAHGSAFPRWLCKQPDIEVVYIADRLSENPLEEPRENFPNTHFDTVPEWADIPWMEQEGVEYRIDGNEKRGPAMENNGYQEGCIGWKWIEAVWRKYHQDAPDLIVVYESAFTPCGTKTLFEGVPCAYLAPDAPRGVDSPLRAAKSMGATDIFQVSPWHQSLFSLHPHMHPDQAPKGQCKFAPNSGIFFAPEHVHVLPMCADPHFFSPPEREPDQPLDIMWAGNERWLDTQGESVERLWDIHVQSGREIIVGTDREAKKFHFEYGDYQQRSRLLWLMLQDEDVPLHIVRSSYARGYAKMMQSAKIVWHCQCGWNAYHMSEAYRIWQATAAGACLVTNETDTIRLYFDESEVATYRLYYHQKHDLFKWFDYQEMKNNLLELLGDEKRRREMGRAAYERTVKDHLPDHRWATIFEKMGMSR